VNQETKAALTKALEAHLRDSNGMPAEEELGDYLVIAVGVAIDGSLQPTARYYTTFKEETILPHVALGLLAKGEEVITDNEQEGGDA
jgi:hypothetical protein